jgi:hypothetical protein
MRCKEWCRRLGNSDSLNLSIRVICTTLERPCNPSELHERKLPAGADIQTCLLSAINNRVNYCRHSKLGRGHVMYINLWALAPMDTSR